MNIAFTIDGIKLSAIKRNLSGNPGNFYKIIRFIDLIPERNRHVNGSYTGRQKNLKCLGLCFKRLQCSIPYILSFNLGTI